MIPGLYSILYEFKQRLIEKLAGYDASVQIGRLDKWIDETTATYIVAVDFDADATEFSDIGSTSMLGNVAVKIGILSPSERYDANCFDVATIVFNAVHGQRLGPEGKYWLWDGKLKELDMEEGLRAFEYIVKQDLKFIDTPDTADANVS